MIKKHIVIILTAILLVVCYTAQANSYIQASVIVDNSNYCLVETFDGNLWEMDRINAEKGNIIILLMDDLGTEQIEDDIIVDYIIINYISK